MASPTFSIFSSLDGDAVKKTIDFSASAVGKVSEHSQKNVEAIAASANAVAKGAEILCAQTAAYSKAAVDSHLAAIKSLSGVKSLQDAVEFQTAHTQASIEHFASAAAKIAQTYSASLKSALQPLSERVTSAAKTLEPSGS